MVELSLIYVTRERDARETCGVFEHAEYLWFGNEVAVERRRAVTVVELEGTELVRRPPKAAGIW